MAEIGARVAGKVAIVTGAAMGMGASHARLLAAEGAKVLVADINAEKGEAVVKEIGAAALFAKLDVAEEAGWLAAVAAAEQAFGPVNVLINNAGVSDMASIEEMELARYRRLIDINQIGCFLGMKTVIPSMRRAGRGAIVNVSSVLGIGAAAMFSAYTATKFAVRGMSKAAAIELAADNIRVNSIHPGTIITSMTEGLANAPKGQAIKRYGEPAEVSNVVLFLVSDESSYVTGAEYAVDGGYLNMVGEIDLSDNV